MAGGDHERKLDQTPTWAVAGVCAVIILFSLALEKGLHKIGMVISLFTQFYLINLCNQFRVSSGIFFIYDMNSRFQD